MKTVRVRIAVAVHKDGNQWSSFGYRSSDGDLPDEEKMGYAEESLDAAGGDFHIVWVEADVPVPEEITVEGEHTNG